MKYKIVLTLIAATLLTSCAHTPTEGDKMMTASDNAKALSKQWNEGDKLSASGDAMQRKGRSHANDGSTMVSKGQNMISDGKDMTAQGRHESARGMQLKQQSENNFSEQYAEQPAS